MHACIDTPYSMFVDRFKAGAENKKAVQRCNLDIDPEGRMGWDEARSRRG